MSPTAQYRGIADRLRQDLKRRRWKAGEQIPSLVELAKEFTCSVNTARDAVQLLVAEGLLYTATSRGTRVRSQLVLDHDATRALRPDRPASSSADALAEIVRTAGRTPGKRFRAYQEPASPMVQALMGLGPEDWVVVREVTQLVDGEVWSRETSYYRRDFAELHGLDDRDDIPEGTTRRMAERGVGETAWTDLVSVTRATPEEADLFGEAVGAPIEHNVRIGANDRELTRVTVLTRSAYSSRLVYELGGEVGRALIREALTRGNVLRNGDEEGGAGRGAGAGDDR